jgi:excisionase family DNA binding protein
MPAPSTPLPRLLTIAEVAGHLHCTPAHVGRLIRNGLLPAHNIALGARRAEWRVSEQALANFIAATSTPLPDDQR